MAGADTFTPNLHLTKIGGDRKNWNDVSNGNMTLLDAVISAFFTVANMRGIWENSTAYAVGDAAVDPDTAVVWVNSVAHTSSMLPTTFAEARTANPTYWAIYTAPATNKGAWAPNTAYSRNDFVLADGTKYAFCLVANTSGASFAADLALGYWSVIIDLSVVGSLVLPVLSGAADALKFVNVNSAGTSYEIVDGTTAMARLDGILPVVNGGTGVATSTGTGSTVLSDDAALDSPTITDAELIGAPTAPTPTALDSSTAIATTAFVTSANKLLQEVTLLTGVLATNTAQIPGDTSIPQITEGTEFMSLAITPKSATSRLIIEVTFIGDINIAAAMIVALFKDAGANAIAVGFNRVDAAARTQTITFKHIMISGSTSPTTFSVRAGGSGASTITFNGTNTVGWFGGTCASSLTIREVAV